MQSINKTLRAMLDGIMPAKRSFNLRPDNSKHFPANVKTPAATNLSADPAMPKVEPGGMTMRQLLSTTALGLAVAAVFVAVTAVATTAAISVMDYAAEAAAVSEAAAPAEVLAPIVAPKPAAPAVKPVIAAAKECKSVNIPEYAGRNMQQVQDKLVYYAAMLSAKVNWVEKPLAKADNIGFINELLPDNLHVTADSPKNDIAAAALTLKPQAIEAINAARASVDLPKNDIWDAALAAKMDSRKVSGFAKPSPVATDVCYETMMASASIGTPAK